MENTSLDAFQQKLKELQLLTQNTENMFAQQTSPEQVAMAPEASIPVDPSIPAPTSADEYQKQLDAGNAKAGEAVASLSGQTPEFPDAKPIGELPQRPEDLSGVSPEHKTDENIPPGEPEAPISPEEQAKAQEAVSAPPAEQDETQDEGNLYKKLYSDLKSKYSSEGDAEELKAAQSNRDNRTLSANLMEGLSDIATGGKTDTKYYDKLRDGAGSKVTDLNERRKQMAENLGVDEKLLGVVQKTVQVAAEAELDDPNSPRLKQLNTLAESQLSKSNPELLAKLKEQGGFPPKTLRGYKEFQERTDKLWEQDYKTQSLADNKENRAVQREATAAYREAIIGQKKTEEKRRVSDKVNNEAQRLGRSDRIINKVREQAQTFDEVQPLLQASADGNEAAIAALGTKMARSMGEVGVLTDADVVRYLGNTSYARQVSSWANRKFEGELPKGQLNDLKKVVNMLNDVYKTKVERNFDLAAQTLVARSKKLGDEIDMDEAHELLGTPGKTALDRTKREQIGKTKSDTTNMVADSSKEPMAPAVDKVTVQDTDGKKYKLPRTQLEKALKQGFTEVK